MSKLNDPLEPLISNVSPFLRPEAKRVASIVPTAPFSKSTTDSTASSTVTAWPSRSLTNVRVCALTASISPTR